MAFTYALLLIYVITSYSIHYTKLYDSPNMEDFVSQHKDMLKADIIAISSYNFV